MKNYTPGPWALHGGDDYINIEAQSGHMILVDTIWPTDDEIEMANARLIAAAPELLEALEFILAVADSHDHFQQNALDQARSAIAKAKGK